MGSCELPECKGGEVYLDMDLNLIHRVFENRNTDRTMNTAKRMNGSHSKT